MKHPFTAEDATVAQQNLPLPHALAKGEGFLNLKFPFSNEGLTLLQEMLYYQNDARLAATAAIIRKNFRKWLLNYFELGESQQQFLQQIDERSLKKFAQETAFAIENRLTILLKKEPKAEQLEQGKIIWDVSTLKAQSGSSGFQASGMLCFHIAYPLA